MITLKVKQLPPGLIEAGNLQPTVLSVLDAAALARQPLGDSPASPLIGDCFGIKVRGEDPILLIEGDISALSGIGRGMNEGVLLLEGHAGPETGAEGPDSVRAQAETFSSIVPASAGSASRGCARGRRSECRG